MHRPTQIIAIAAAAVTAGALALPVSAAFAESEDELLTDGTTVSAPPSGTGTPTIGLPGAEQPSTAQPSTGEVQDVQDRGAQPETEAPEAPEAPEADDVDGDAPAPVAPAAPAKPWHVKARLADRNSAVVAWRDTDTAGVRFTITLVPVGRTTASTLPALTGTATTRSVQFDGLVAGARYRATVTATTDAGAAVSTSSNVVVTPKAKSTKSPKASRPAKAAKPAKAAEPAKHASHAKATKGPRTVHQPKAGTHTGHASAKAKHTAKHGR